MTIKTRKDKLLPVREVAKLLFVHPNTLRRWADKGIIEAYRITPRGDRRFRFEDISRFKDTMINGSDQQK